MVHVFAFPLLSLHKPKVYSLCPQRQPARGRAGQLRTACMATPPGPCSSLQTMVHAGWGLSRAALALVARDWDLQSASQLLATYPDHERLLELAGDGLLLAWTRECQSPAGESAAAAPERQPQAAIDVGRGVHLAPERPAVPAPADEGEPRTGSTTPSAPSPVEAEGPLYCSCGRNCARAGRRWAARCCSHCPRGTHTESCVRRERRRARATARRSA